MTDTRDEKDGHDRPSLEKYLGMKEHEKDAEIQKAVVRLQKRIHELLYSLEPDHHADGKGRRRKEARDQTD